MWNLLIAQLAIEGAQFAFLRVLKRTTISVCGKVQHSFKMLRLRIQQQFPELFGALFYGQAQRLERTGIGILRRELPKLLESVDQLQRIVAHIMQLGPESIDLGGLRFIQHQPAQMIVLAVIKRERHDFINGNDFGVAECCRKQFTKLIERSLNAFSRSAAVVDQNR